MDDSAVDDTIVNIPGQFRVGTGRGSSGAGVGGCLPEGNTIPPVGFRPCGGGGVALNRASARWTSPGLVSETHRGTWRSHTN